MSTDRFRWQDLTPDHVRALTPAGRFKVFADVRAAWPGLSAAACAGPARAGIRRGAVLVAGGVLPTGPGAGAAWMAAGAIAPRDYPEITAVAHAVLLEAHRRGMRSILAHVRRDWPEAQRWIRRLGFALARTVAVDGAAYDVWIRGGAA